jgi:hypothetical protein
MGTLPKRGVEGIGGPKRKQVVFKVGKRRTAIVKMERKNELALLRKIVRSKHALTTREILHWSGEETPTAVFALLRKLIKGGVLDRRRRSPDRPA